MQSDMAMPHRAAACTTACPRLRHGGHAGCQPTALLLLPGRRFDALCWHRCFSKRGSLPLKPLRQLPTTPFWTMVPQLPTRRRCRCSGHSAAYAPQRNTQVVLRTITDPCNSPLLQLAAVLFMGWLRTALLLAALAVLLAPPTAHGQIVPKACQKVHKDDFVIEKGVMARLCKGEPLTECAPRCKTALQRVGRCCGDALHLVGGRDAG
jgi:hypothetical protein